MLDSILPVTALFLTHLVATWALVGLIWTIQIVHYPLFAQVGREAFPEYHRRHTRCITWIVAPLMAVELISGIALALEDSSGILRWSLGLLGFNWVSTACIQIPLHNRLEKGFEARAHAWLVRSNWGRTLAWSGRAFLLALAALR